MIATECIHSDFTTPDTCTLCREASEPPEPIAPRMKKGPEFPARFDGRCPSCNLPIVKGQPIQAWSDGKYRHGGNRPCRP